MNLLSLRPVAILIDSRYFFFLNLLFPPGVAQNEVYQAHQKKKLSAFTGR